MRFPYNKFGLLVDPVGEYVSMLYKGRTLLGEVVETYRREFPFSAIIAQVKHFNGESWPIEPGVLNLTWIKQDGRSEP